MKTYTYIFQSNYGSPEVDHTNPKITKVVVSADRKSARLFVDKLQRGHVHELHMPGVRSADGLPLLHNIGYYTLNYIPEPPKVSIHGKPYSASGVSFKPRASEAKWSGKVNFRHLGQKEYRHQAIEIAKDGKLSAIVPATVTEKPFKYYLKFSEAGQLVLTQPSGGAARSIQMRIDTRPAIRARRSLHQPRRLAGRHVLHDSRLPGR
ncbi:MAG TPA: hypothetical protein QF564_24140 [Pirellulaceae bacterium]|nr:hypothetical protein [Pirellulaceae bacterium]